MLADDSLSLILTNTDESLRGEDSAEKKAVFEEVGDVAWLDVVGFIEQTYLYHYKNAS